MENQESICMSQYSYKEHLLYSSKDSQVYKAINKHNKGSQAFVFKGYPQSWLTDPLKEKKLMQQLNSLWKLHGKDNILQIISQHSRDKKVFIITEYCEFGTLAQEIKKEGKFNEQKSVVYIKQIIKGYQSIFQSQIIHRNLQPSSILNAGLDLKIADFSDSIKANEIEMVTLREEMVGNVHFQPYEVLASYRYTVKSDVYSIGAILFCMLKGKPPYQGTKSEILAAMKNNTIAAEIASIANKKIQFFLERTLSMSEEKRMGVEELCSFDFEIVPQLNRLKLFTFDDREDQPSVAHFYEPSFDRQPSQKDKKEEDPVKLLFKNFDLSEKKLSFVDLKISDDLDLSRYYKDKEISIFIPTKLDMTTSQNLVDESLLMKNLDLERVDSLEKRPSDGLPLRKKAGTNKEIANNIYSDLMKSQTLNKSKRYNETAKDLPIISEKQLQKETNQESPRIEMANVRATSLEERQPSINVISCNTEGEIIPPLEFKEKSTPQPCSQIQNKTAFLKNKPLTDRSNQDKGLITLRGRQNIIGSMGVNQHKDSLIAGWLVSQIDMFRFLNRLLFKLKKAEHNYLNELSSSISRLKDQLLVDVKSLKCLQAQDAQSFKQSPQYSKIIEIVQAYESSTSLSRQFQGYDRLNKLILAKIQTLYNQLIASSEFKEDMIKVVDYLITFWQLVKLLKKNDAQYFHNKSKIQEILDSKESRLTIEHLLKLYERMKILKLI